MYDLITEDSYRRWKLDMLLEMSVKEDEKNERVKSGQFTEQGITNKGHGNKETYYVLSSNKRKTKFPGY